MGARARKMWRSLKIPPLFAAVVASRGEQPPSVFSSSESVLTGALPRLNAGRSILRFSLQAIRQRPTLAAQPPLFRVLTGHSQRVSPTITLAEVRGYLSSRLRNRHRQDRGRR